MPHDVANSLRDIALRLNRFSEFKSPRNIADGALLSLLKAGKLTAKIQYPGRPEVWLAIPLSYWANVSSDQIRSLRRGKGKNLVGDYKIETSSISGEFAHELLQLSEQDKLNPEASTAWIEQEIKQLLAASGPHEAVVFESEWQEFVTDEKLAETGGPRGRRERTSWAKLSPIIGAYFLSRGANPPNYPDNDDQMAAEIRQQAIKENIKDLPSQVTLRGVVSEILSRAQSISKK
jgi:hypothetical protein